MYPNSTGLTAATRAIAHGANNLLTFLLNTMVLSLLCSLAGLSAVTTAVADQPVTAASTSKSSTADHRQFTQLQGPFASANEVTDACLSCHTEAGKQVMDTLHWTWEYIHPETQQRLGKRHVINAFCGNVASNEARCTSCHAGYGWEDTKRFDFTNESQVDCLACHDTTGDYIKWPDKAGHPLYESKTQKNRNDPYPDSLIVKEESGLFTHLPPDLTRIASRVGLPGSDNCGNCHFYGGGGDNVKHGDLSSALISPSPHVDVHLSPDGANLQCSDCHVSSAHHWPGSRYNGTVNDSSVARAGMRNTDVLACNSCHTNTPHPLTIVGTKLNQHTDRIACQTCHIPEFAKGGKATKMWWDWSTAGKLKDGKPYAEYDDQHRHTYLSTKGDFRWEENVIPEYRYWDGVISYTLLGEKIDPSKVVSINRIQGSSDDPDSRLYPFKRMTGRQAYDTEIENLLFSNVYGPDSDTAFWSNFDWAKSLAAGMAETGVEYSGHYGFVDTEMWWPTTHMVSPAAEALACDSCHSRAGRLESLTGFYLPGRDRFKRTDAIGLSLLLFAVMGIAFHGGLRMYFRRRRNHRRG